MKQDMVDRLWNLFFHFDPNFEAVFKTEFPHLSDDDKLRFLRLLRGEMDSVLGSLQGLSMEEAAH